MNQESETVSGRCNNDLNLYKIIEKEKTLRFEIDSAELQLKHVDDRFHHLQLDIKIFVGVLLSPILVSLIRIILSSGLGHVSTMDTTLYVTIGFIYVLFLAIYVLLFPVMLYNLLKSIFLYIEHNKDYSNQRSMEIKPQQERYEPKKSQSIPECNYRMEQEKLHWILCKYYLYQDNFNKLKDRIRSNDQVTNLEVDEALNSITFYEKIIPANPFNGVALHKAKIWSLVGSLLIIGGFLYMFLSKFN